MFLANKPVKRITLKNLRPMNKLPEGFEDHAWHQITTSISQFFDNTFNGARIELSQTVETLMRFGVHVMPRIRQEIEKQICLVRDKIKHVIQVDGRSDMSLLALFDDVWVRMQAVYVDLSIICTSLSEEGKGKAKDLIYEYFGKFVINDELIKDELIDAILRQLNEIRQISQPVETATRVKRAQLKRLVDMFVIVKLYSINLEPAILISTTTFYQQYPVNETTKFLDSIKDILQFEEELSKELFPSSSLRPLVHSVEQVLIEARLAQILGLLSLFFNENDDIAIVSMYELVKRIDRLTQLYATWHNVTKQVGIQIILDKPNDQLMIDNLLSLRDRIDRLHNTLNNDTGMQTASKEAFEHFCNLRGNRPAELLAQYVDAILRQSVKEIISEEELSTRLDRALTIFRYLHGKDIFEAYYKRDLARRLLLGRHAAMDVERGMLKRLQAECGSGFTSRMESMFKDMAISKELDQHYRNSKQFKKQTKSLEFNATVITTGIWPYPPPIEITLPTEIEIAQKRYTEFYLERHKGRKFVWNQHLGHCLIKAHFNSGDKELILSVLQASILMQFNNTNELTFKDLYNLLKMEEQILGRTLQSLCSTKLPILLKSPSKSEIRNTDRFTLNPDFTHPQYRIKVPSLSAKDESQDDEKSIREVVTLEVEQDRQHQLDAAIVRVVKHNKTIKLVQLVKLIVEEVKFPTNSDLIKARIEALAERDYLARSGEEDDEIITYAA